MTETFTCSIEVPAKPDAVFEYFIDAKLLVAWIGDYAVLDAQPGGEFTLDIEGIPVRGQYLEVVAPERVVVSWGHAGSETLPPNSTQVQFSLTPTAGGGTLVEVEHRNLPTEHVPSHSTGWPMFMERLRDACESGVKLSDYIAFIGAHSFTPSAERPGDTPASGLFVEAACLDYAEDGPSPADRIALAHRMLDADASLATASIEAVATVGDHRSLATLLDADPTAVNRLCGPNRWPPLLYATYARVSANNPSWSALETVRVLLDRGADPNAGFLWRGSAPPFTALTGAFGGGESHEAWHIARFAIARLLLDAGADPNDGQLLYNNGIGGQNHDDPSHLQLLAEYGLGTPQNGPWYQGLGDLLRQPGELLYDELEAAAKRNRPAVLRYLLSLRLDLNRPIGRSQQTPVRIAAAEGHQAILDVLAETGIDTSLTAIEQAHEHTRTNDVDGLRQILEEHPAILDELRRDHPGLCKRVAAGQAAMLELLIGLGFDINDRAGTKTALHHAAEADDTASARLLMAHGADPNLVDTHIHATPWGWANHFGNADTAAYLHPLTNHDAALPEITVRHGEGKRELATPALIEAALDAIHGPGHPVLVTLSSGDASLTVGLGHQTHSVALYRDADGSAWHAQQPDVVAKPTLTFGQGTSSREFAESAAIDTDLARTIVREFINDAAVKPASVHWVAEGAGATP